MAIPTTTLERERLLKLIKEYRDQGYEASFNPTPEELPDFLKGYEPDIIMRRAEEAVVIEVKSRSSLSSSSAQYLSHLAKVIKQHPRWRFDLVVINPDDAMPVSKAEGSLQDFEIRSGLQVARRLSEQHPESAILYAWSMVEATLRLIAENEELSLERFDPSYLVRRLTIEGVLSKAEYQTLIDALSLRNAIAHGFKATQITQDSVCELIGIAEQLLSTPSVDTVQAEAMPTPGKDYRATIKHSQH
jgi:hypothetical protein